MKTNNWITMMTVSAVLISALPGNLARADVPSNQRVAKPLVLAPKHQQVLQPNPPEPPPAQPENTVVAHGVVRGVTQDDLAIEAFLGDEILARVPVQPNGEFVLPPLPTGGFGLRVLRVSGELIPLAEDSVDSVRGLRGQTDEFVVLTLGAGSPSAETGGGASAETPTQAQANGIISGFVTTAATGAPVQNIYVQAYKVGTDYSSDSDYTQSTGGFKLSVSPGVYQVVVDEYNYTAYAPEWYGGAYARSGAFTMTVADGQTLTGINVQLDVGGAIKGVVTVNGNFGVAFSSPSVQVYTATTSVNPIQSVMPNSSNGVYQVQGLASGTYYLRFGTASDTEWIFEYYDNKPTLATAQGIAVTLGTTATANADLAVGGVITGFVRNAATGAGFSSGEVRVYVSNGTETFKRKTPTFGTGAYRIAGLPTGIYQVEFAPYSAADGLLAEWYNDKRSRSQADVVNVSEGVTTTTINFDLERGGALVGTVTGADNGAPLPNAYVTAYTSTAASGSGIAYDYADNAGKYELKGLSAGNYYLRFEGSSSNGYLAEWYNNKIVRANADPIAITLNTTTTIDAALDKGGMIKGRITDASSGLGVGNAYAYAYSSTVPSYASGSASSDASGYYTITGLSAGNYFLKFDPPYNSLLLGEWHNNKPNQASADAVAVALNSTSMVDAALDKGGMIKGRVLSADTSAPVNSNVCAYTSTLFAGSRNCDQPDAQGYYTITQLLTGNYYIFFNSYNNNYLDEYYNNVYRRTQAVAVAAQVGAVTDNINATLDRGGSVLGRVTGADTGAGLKNVYVRAYGNGENYVDECGITRTVTYNGYAYTDASGYYTITDLLPSVYRVDFDAQYDSPYIDQSYPTPITVTIASSTPNINAALVRAGTIRGRVVADGSSTGLSGVAVAVYTKFSNGNTSYQNGTSTDASGYYTVTGLGANTYYVNFYTYNSGIAQDYKAEWYNDKPDSASATPVVVAAAATADNINAGLALGGKIKGRVTDPQGQPVPNIYVDAYPNGAGATDYARTDASGFYTISGMYTGNYTVTFDMGYSSDNNSVKLLAYEVYNNKALRSQATLVGVTEGNTTDNINAQLEYGGRINGVVIEQDTRTPVKGGYVYAYDIEGHGARSAYTSNFGNYSLSGLPTGNYKVYFGGTSRTTGCSSVYHDGVYYNQVTGYLSATLVSVTAPDGVNNINAALPLRGTAPQPFVAFGAGVIAGRVVNTATQPIAGIEIRALRLNSGVWTVAALASTNSDGRYTITGLGEADYRVYFKDSAAQYQDEYFDNAATLANASNISITNGITGTANAELAKALPPLMTINAGSASAVTDPRTGEVTVRMPRGSSQSITVTRDIKCPDGSAPTNVQLVMVQNGVALHTYTMTQVSAGTYQAVIPRADLVSGAQLETRYTCGVPVVVVVGNVQLYDPSGIVSDASTGLPILNATVTLYTVPGWRARTNITDTVDATCESNLSKASGALWSQPAPTDLGTLALPASGTISPTINPQKTNSVGYYGWDVAAGCWYVVVTADGYRSKVSSVVGVPPAVLDLNIQLRKEGGVKIYLPGLRK